MLQCVMAGLIALLGAVEPPCTALTGGRVFAEGRLQEGLTVVIEGERVAAVAAGAVAPARCRTLDVSGQVVTPGLIDPFTRLGALEVPLEPATVDHDAGAAAGPVRAAFQVADAYNPRSVLIPVARREGVTAVLTLPVGGVVSGRSAFAELDGATQRQAVRRSVTALHASIGGGDGSRAASWALLRQLFEEAALFQRTRAQWERNASRPFANHWRDLEAVQAALAREVPLVVQADRASDIEAALALARAHDLRLVVAGGAEAWLLADALAERRVGVIVDPLLYGPGSFDQVHARVDNAAMLRARGVPVMLSTFDAHNVRRLRQIAGNAVRGGLPWEAALEAITRTPAEVFGWPDQGRLQAGAVANVVVWSGDPLELSTRAERVFVRGREVSLETRQTKLRDRYLTLPGTPAPPLPLP